MRILAWSSWAIAVFWMAAVVIGALGFQELYGGWSGTQVIAVGVIPAAVMATIGSWASRRR